MHTISMVPDILKCLLMWFLKYNNIGLKGVDVWKNKCSAFIFI